MREYIIEEKCKLMEGQLLECHTKVLVLALDSDGNIIVVSAYQHLKDEWTLELPSGDLLYREQAKDASIRVLLTETGLYAEKLESLGIYNPKSSVIDVIYLFVATDLTNIRSHLQFVFDNRVLRMSPNQLAEMINDGVFVQEAGIKAFTKFYLSLK